MTNLQKRAFWQGFHEKLAALTPDQVDALTATVALGSSLPVMYGAYRFGTADEEEREKLRRGWMLPAMMVGAALPGVATGVGNLVKSRLK